MARELRSLVPPSGTVQGVPAEAVLLNIGAFGLFGMIAGSLLWWLLIFPIHRAMVLHNRRNPALYARVAALVRRHTYLSTCGSSSFCLPITAGLHRRGGAGRDAPLMARDTLYLACTRPAMKWGVPADGYWINAGGTFVFGLVMGSPLWWGLFFLFHWFMRLGASRDPNVFRELRLWSVTKLFIATLHAMPIGRARKAREMPGAA